MNYIILHYIHSFVSMAVIYTLNHDCNQRYSTIIKIRKKYFVLI